MLRCRVRLKMGIVENFACLKLGLNMLLLLRGGWHTSLRSEVTAACHLNAQC